MQMIAKHGSGVVLYMHQEGRGIGLLEKLKAYNLQDEGLDTVDANLALGHQADARNYDAAVGMLADLGITKVRLMTNNPCKEDELSAAGVTVSERVALIPQKVTRENYRYLQTKSTRMNHTLGARFEVGEQVNCPPVSESKLAESTLPQDRPAVLYSNKAPFPVVDVNDMWLETCGFQRDEVIGKTMRIIQGPLTEGKEVERLMDTIFLASHPSQAGTADDPSSKYTPPSAKMWNESEVGGKKPATVTLINYTKDRTAFRNEVEVLPSADGSDHLVAVSKMTALDEGSLAQPPLLTQAETTTESQTEALMEAAVRCYAEGGMVLVADDEGACVYSTVHCTVQPRAAYVLVHHITTVNFVQAGRWPY